MIFKVFGTLFTFKVFLQRPCNFNLACSFSAHLPKFNPAIPKLHELGGNLQGLQSKTIKVNIVRNTSKIILPHGFNLTSVKRTLMYIHMLEIKHFLLSYIHVKKDNMLTMVICCHRAKSTDFICAIFFLAYLTC